MPAGLQVLEEWINSCDATKIVLAACLLKETSRSFVFSNVPFVSNLLWQAQKAGLEPYKRVVSYLWSSAISGGRIGTPGQPMPEDVSIRDQALKVLEQLPAGSPEYRFYESLAKDREAMIRNQLAEDEELAE
jgi:hypothetical protein